MVYFVLQHKCRISYDVVNQIKHSITYEYVEYLDHADPCITYITNDPDETSNAKPVTKARGKSRAHQSALLLQQNTKCCQVHVILLAAVSRFKHILPLTT